MKELRAHATGTPAAPDAAEALALLEAEALTRLTKAVEGADAEVTSQLLDALVGPAGAPLPGTAQAVADVARMARAGVTLWDAAALEPHASGDTPLASLATVLRTKSLAAAAEVFRDTSAAGLSASAKSLASGGWRCAAATGPEAAECPAEWFGLPDAASLAAVPSAALPLLRAALLARSAATPPSGIVALPSDPEAAPPGAGIAGERTSWLPAETLVVRKEGASLTERPHLDLATGKLVAGRPWPGEIAQNAESLEAVKDTEGVAKLSRAAGEARLSKEREEALSGAPAGRDPRNAARASGAWVIGASIAPEVPASVFAPALAAAQQAGFGQLRVQRDAGTLPVLLGRDAVPEARSRAEEPMRVSLGVDAVKVIAARSKAAPMAPAEVPPAFAEAAKVVKKGERVVSAELATTDTAAIVELVKAVRDSEGSGAVIVVELRPEVTAARAFEVVAALGAVGPAAQTGVGEVYPGVACSDEDPAAGACMSAFVVLDVALPEPKKAVEKVEKPAPPPEEPKEQVECDKADIKSVISARTGAIRFCYERQLQLNNELKGKVVVRLTIGSGGAVTAASSSGNMPDKSVHECVVKAMKALKFKPPSGGGSCVVNYPFSFQP